MPYSHVLVGKVGNEHLEGKAYEATMSITMLYYFDALFTLNVLSISNCKVIEKDLVHQSANVTL